MTDGQTIATGLSSPRPTSAASLDALCARAVRGRRRATGVDPGNVHCENHCGWRGTEDELIPDPDQSESDEDQNGTRYVCPRCLTCCAMIDDADTE